jgi:hypothetical protein
MVKAKCRCTRIVDWGGSREVFLHPVQNTSDDNKSWSQWTPDGEVRLKITNPAAYEQFKVGQEYYVDFNVAVPEVAAQTA